MKVKWEVDDHTTVEAEIRYFGKHRLIVNGTVIPAQISKRRRRGRCGGWP